MSVCIITQYSSKFTSISEISKTVLNKIFISHYPKHAAPWRSASCMHMHKHLHKCMKNWDAQFVIAIREAVRYFSKSKWNSFTPLQCFHSKHLMNYSYYSPKRNRNENKTQSSISLFKTMLLKTFYNTGLILKRDILFISTVQIQRTYSKTHLTNNDQNITFLLLWFLTTWILRNNHHLHQNCTKSRSKN